MSDNEVIVTIESTLLELESTRITLGIVGNSKPRQPLRAGQS